MSLNPVVVARIENGKLTAHRYLTEVLKDHVLAFMVILGDDATFIHGNTRPHTARIVSAYLEKVQITQFVWPALSPDLNPIEHVWDELVRHLRRLVPASRNSGASQYTNAGMGQSSTECDPKHASSFAGCYYCQRREY